MTDDVDPYAVMRPRRGRAVAIGFGIGSLVLFGAVAVLVSRAGIRGWGVTDSLLMLKSMTQWLGGWKRRGWKTAGGDPVKNQDLVLALEAEIARHAQVRWHWVKGHAQSVLNDRADQLAVEASHAARDAA